MMLLRSLKLFGLAAIFVLLACSCSSTGTMVAAQEDGADEGGSALALQEGGEEDDLDAPKAEVIILSGANFEHDTQVATGATTGDWFIKFYAPWCGHCKKMSPVWDELAQVLSGEANVAKVDLTLGGNSALKGRFGIQGFPTLLFFSKGSMYRYKGRRNVEDMAAFARGGYKRAEALEVPPESQDLLTVAKEAFNSLSQDIAGLKEGKTPQPLTIGVLGGVAMVFLLLVMSCFSGKNKAKKS